jgi:cytochrome c-type biogenesis protein CcmH/NrfG
MIKGLCGAALVGMLLPALACCQEAPPTNPERETQLKRMDEIQLEQMELKLEQQRAEADFQREMRSLELESRRLDLARAGQEREGGGIAVLLILCAVVHILVAVWVYQDIRQRSAGSGLWIVLGLLAGLLAALVYAVVRLGDTDGGKKASASR